MKKLIVVADWAADSLTCQEVRTSVEGNIKSVSHPAISFVAATPSTIHTAFLINQVVEIEERYGKPADTVLFENTDARIHTKNSVKHAQGAHFIVARLHSGMLLCGPNSGYNFSLIKKRVAEIFVYRNLDRGSQFRSRDLYSLACARLMEKRDTELDLEKARIDIIPDLNGSFIGHIDNYGNIKTTVTLDALGEKAKFGNLIAISINGITKKVKFVDNLFGGTPGELVLYPGSSGEKDNPYLEISVWRHFTEEEKTTGLHAFHNPLPGSKIEVHL